MVLQGQKEIELVWRQVLEDRQYPAATIGHHEVIGVLHAGSDAGQVFELADSERTEPDC